MGQTPESLIKVGIPQHNLAIKASIINKAKDGKNDGHKLDEETIGKVLEALHNPIAIAKDADVENQKSNNRYGIILDIKDMLYLRAQMHR